MTENIIKQLIQYYGIDFYDAAPFRDGYIFSVRQNDGACQKLLLKRNDSSKERISFNHLVKTHLYKNGFKNTDIYVTSVDDMPYVELEGELYTLSHRIEGIEAQFDSPADTARSAVALAAMHKASGGASYDLVKYSFAVKDLGSLERLFCHRVNELKKFKRLSAKGKSLFDYEYNKLADYFIEEGERTIIDLRNSSYTQLVEKTLSNQNICHHDFTSHNVIFNSLGTYITGFENCCIEIKEYDIANFLRRKMRRTGWSLSDAKNIMDNYRSVLPMSEAELDMVRIILRFPQKLWRIVNKYYNSRKSWCERSCLEKMSDTLCEKEPLRIFLDNFDVIY